MNVHIHTTHNTHIKPGSSAENKSMLAGSLEKQVQETEQERRPWWLLSSGLPFSPLAGGFWPSFQVQISLKLRVGSLPTVSDICVSRKSLFYWHSLPFLLRPESLCWGALPLAEVIILLNMQIPWERGQWTAPPSFALEGEWDSEPGGCTCALGCSGPMMQKTELFQPRVLWNSCGDG